MLSVRVWRVCILSSCRETVLSMAAAEPREPELDARYSTLGYGWLPARAATPPPPLRSQG